MADPISIAASIVAFLQAGNAAAEGLKRVYKAREAQSVIHELQQDAQNLENAVQALEDHLKLQPRFTETAMSSLRRSILAAKNAAEGFDRMMREKLKGSGESRIKKRLYFKADIVGHVERQRGALTRAAEGLNRAAVLCLVTVVPAQAVTSIIELVGSETAASETQESASDDSGSEQIVDGGMRTDLVQHQNVANILSDPTPDICRPASGRQSFCTRRWCDCACHQSQFSRTRTQFRSILGTLSYEGTSLPWQSARCTSPSCGSSSSERRIYYVFPSWICQRMIYVRLAAAWSCGPELLLRVHNRRPLDSDIFIACMNSNVHMLKQCLAARNGSIFDVDDDLGCSLMIWCIISNGRHIRHNTGAWQCIRLLVTQGADPMLSSDDGGNAYDAAWNDSMEDYLSGREYPFGLVQFALDDEKLGLTELHSAILGLEDALSVDTALARTPRSQIDVTDVNGATPLAYAAAKGDLHTMQKLLSKGACPWPAQTNSSSPPLYACMAYSTAALELLFDSGLDMNDNGQYRRALLHHLFEYVDLDESLNPCIGLLVSRGLNVNAREHSGYTAMSKLVMYAEDTSAASAVLDYLLSCGADPSIANPVTAWTSVHWAIYLYKPRLLRVLLHHDKSLAGAVTSEGYDTLALAADSSIAVVQALLDAQIDVDYNLKDFRSRTWQDRVTWRYQSPIAWRWYMMETVTATPDQPPLSDDPDEFLDLFYDLVHDIKRRRRKRLRAEAATLHDDRDIWKAARSVLDGDLLLAYDEHRERYIPGSFPED